MIKLGVNVDHVATIRQARGTCYPCPIDAALAAIRGGADQITIHLREDRRHIQDRDITLMRSTIKVPLNLEMAAADEIIGIACKIRPDTATLVPERREELTTEGGLDVAGNYTILHGTVSRLKASGIAISMFIDPEIAQVEASLKLGSDAVEFHTGSFCDAKDGSIAAKELERLIMATRFAARSRIKLCVGHGINYDNAASIVRALPQAVEYNIGHSIVARAIFVGMEQAVREMKNILDLRPET